MIQEGLILILCVRYQELEESLHQKESRVDQLQGQKKVLEKKIRESEKTLDSLLNEVESNSKVFNLNQLEINPL